MGGGKGEGMQTVWRGDRIVGARGRDVGVGQREEGIGKRYAEECWEERGRGRSG